MTYLRPARLLMFHLVHILRGSGVPELVARCAEGVRVVAVHSLVEGVLGGTPEEEVLAYILEGEVLAAYVEEVLAAYVGEGLEVNWVHAREALREEVRGVNLHSLVGCNEYFPYLALSLTFAENIGYSLDIP